MELDPVNRRRGMTHVSGMDAYLRFDMDAQSARYFNDLQPNSLPDATANFQP